MLTVFNLVSVAAMALTVVGPAGARAETAPSIRVSTVGVNFDDQRDVAVFYAHLKQAAASVCDTNSANPRVTQGDQVCTQQVIAKAVEVANWPLLTALHTRS